MQKKIPARKCVGCGEMKEKKDLIRVIKTPEGDICLDATYKANGVPDIGTETMIAVCKDVFTDFADIQVGELLWMQGHVGIYIGDGLAVECTTSWKNCVQITAVHNIGKKSGYNGRKWTKHGKLPYISYPAKAEPAESFATIKLPVLKRCDKNATVKALQPAGLTVVDPASLTAGEIRALTEQHVISPAFARDTHPRMLLTEEAMQAAVMLEEEDHVRIQTFAAGFALTEAYETAAKLDALLDEGMRIAYSEELGYLTHCPTNLGTGMRASVMMFLPALTMVILLHSARVNQTFMIM